METTEDLEETPALGSAWGPSRPAHASRAVTAHPLDWSATQAQRGETSETAQARDPAQQETLLRVPWNHHASPQGKPGKLRGADGKMLCLQGSGSSLPQPMQKTQLSSPSPSLLPPLHAPHSHYLVGFRKDRRLLPEHVFVLHQLPALLLRHTAQQVSDVLWCGAGAVVAPFRRRQKRELTLEALFLYSLHKLGLSHKGTCPAKQ